MSIVTRPKAALTLVPTPIGNLDDITLRAIKTLQETDAILAEDTRNTGRLLQHLEITKPLIPYHAHNEHHITPQLIGRMKNGECFALVTDAGTPGISDPAFLLVRAAIEADISIESLPGATAFVPALVNSGLPTERFVFEGFLPVKKGRKTRLLEIAEESKTIIFYESPYRLVSTLEDLAAYLGSERKASVSRELTKLFEETRRGTLAELTEHYKTKSAKGEIVIVVAGKP
jgi:16S rRNA (cytidine1402-2'-O)-methyltransferase